MARSISPVSPPRDNGEPPLRQWRQPLLGRQRHRRRIDRQLDERRHERMAIGRQRRHRNCFPGVVTLARSFIDQFRGNASTGHFDRRRKLPFIPNRQLKCPRPIWRHHRSKSCYKKPAECQPRISSRGLIYFRKIRLYRRRGRRRLRDRRHFQSFKSRHHFKIAGGIQYGLQYCPWCVGRGAISVLFDQRTGTRLVSSMSQILQHPA